MPHNEASVLGPRRGSSLCGSQGTLGNTWTVIVGMIFSLVLFPMQSSSTVLPGGEEGLSPLTPPCTHPDTSPQNFCDGKYSGLFQTPEDGS